MGLENTGAWPRFTFRTAFDADIEEVFIERARFENKKHKNRPWSPLGALAPVE